MKVTVRSADLGRAQRFYEFQPDTLDVEARTVEMVFTTGARGKRFGWPDDFYEELEVSKKAMRLGKLNNGAPFLDLHNSYSNDSVLGVIERAWETDGEGWVKVRFDETEIAEKRMKSIKNGILKNVSVGYDVHEFREMEEKAEDGLPIYRAVDWEPREVSLVPIGFDDDSMIRSNKQGPVNPCVLTREEEGSDNMDPKANDKKPVESSLTEADVKRAATEAKAEAIKLERERVRKIETLGSALGMYKRAKELAVEEKTADEAQEILIREKAEIDAKAKTNPTVSVGEDDKSKKTRAFQDAIMFRANKKRYADMAKENPYARASFMQMVRHRMGSEVEFMKDRAVLKRAMANSTSDFPILLSNVAGRVLRDEFKYLGNNYEGIIRRTEAPDFKDIEQDRLGDAANMLLVKEGEDYQKSTIGESKEVYRVAKYGRTFPITFEALVNDNLGAFGRISQKIAVAALRLERNLVWDTWINNPLMSDGKAWFSSEHANLAATGSDLSETSLSAAYVSFMAQKGDSTEGDDYLDIPPAYLIVAPANKVTANKLVASITATKTSDVNPFAGDLIVIVEPKLAAQNSGKTWYLSASPGAIDTMELAYLEEDGGLVIDEIPEIKNDTIEWKSRLIAGSAPIEWRGVYKNAGSA